VVGAFVFAGCYVVHVVEAVDKARLPEIACMCAVDDNGHAIVEYGEELTLWDIRPTSSRFSRR
jgi:hypothetical protein